MWWTIYIFPGWIKSKKADTHPINKSNHNCFQYTVIVVLNHEYTGKHPERITKLRIL